MSSSGREKLPKDANREGVEPGEWRPHVGELLRDAFHLFLEELFAGLESQGFDDIRPAHSPVFQHLERSGTRIGVLAERAQMTNQSMGYLVDALERRGYVERQPDPVDRRAALVVITERGRHEIAAARRLIEQIESDWEQRIGSELMTALWSALEEINRSRPSGKAPAAAGS